MDNPTFCAVNENIFTYWTNLSLATVQTNGEKLMMNEKEKKIYMNEDPVIGHSGISLVDLLFRDFL